MAAYLGESRAEVNSATMLAGEIEKARHGRAFRDRDVMADQAACGTSFGAPGFFSSMTATAAIMQATPAICRAGM
ncbi:hypothetical protein FHW37_105172 [Neorhizobium alkalisoli]|uniref:Uncharacterized protein n=1 Tax=Neorhizobium alkalisoli TaxID=528178 RepID=A0A561QNW8_9HYPH|nr:hypothetical protein FHW37_105172 [Neorhizobium alkalisoli]